MNFGKESGILQFLDDVMCFDLTDEEYRLQIFLLTVNSVLSLCVIIFHLILCLPEISFGDFREYSPFSRVIISIMELDARH
jgi:hypothetical protein